jgi:hypothetical protein
VEEEEEEEEDETVKEKALKVRLVEEPLEFPGEYISDHSGFVVDRVCFRLRRNDRHQNRICDNETSVKTILYYL